MEGVWQDPVLADDEKLAVFGEQLKVHELPADDLHLDPGLRRSGFAVGADRQGREGSRGGDERTAGDRRLDRYRRVVMASSEAGRAGSLRAVRPPRAPRRGGPAAERGRRSLIAWLFALPFVLIFGVFLLVPLVSSFVMSFTDFTSRDVQNPFAVEFVGLDQFAALFGNQQFLRSLLNTAYFVAVGIPLTMVAGLALAVALNNGSIGSAGRSGWASTPRW